MTILDFIASVRPLKSIIRGIPENLVCHRAQHSHLHRKNRKVCIVCNVKIFYKQYKLCKCVFYCFNARCTVSTLLGLLTQLPESFRRQLYLLLWTLCNNFFTEKRIRKLYAKLYLINFSRGCSLNRKIAISTLGLLIKCLFLMF